jgi:hypothetical protein
MARELGLSARSALTARAIGNYLVRHDAIEVAVIKNGIEGATVVTRSSWMHVPAYVTENVFKIGSGDVFSGIFAIHWAYMNTPAGEAAKLASMATAHYANRQQQVIPEMITSLEEGLRDGEQSVLGSFPRLRRSRRVYLAGPLFTVAQTYFLDEVRRCLEAARLEVFSPKDDVGLVKRASDIRKVAKADLEGLESCGIVFALLDGMDPGTLFELGYAVDKRHKPVIAFGERLAQHDLTMLRGTGCGIYTDLTTAVYHAAWLASR